MKMPPRPAELDKLDGMVGNWDYTIKIEIPGMDKPITAKGTSHSEWACDKRVVVEHVNGDPDEHGVKFAGMSITMYDAHDKVYRTFWCDNEGRMDHGTMTYDEATKTWRSKGTGQNTMTGEHSMGKGTVKVSDDNNTLEWSGTQYDSWGMSKKMTMTGTSKRKM